jgi:hypothetical protein
MLIFKKKIYENDHAVATPTVTAHPNFPRPLIILQYQNKEGWRWND